MDKDYRQVKQPLLDFAYPFRRVLIGSASLAAISLSRQEACLLGPKSVVMEGKGAQGAPAFGTRGSLQGSNPPCAMLPVVISFSHSLKSLKSEHCYRDVGMRQVELQSGR